MQIKNSKAIVIRNGNPYSTCAVCEGCPNKPHRKRSSLAPALVVDCGYKAAISRDERIGVEVSEIVPSVVSGRMPLSLSPSIR